MLDSKLPGGPIEKSWDTHRFNLKLVNPANKRKFEILECISYLYKQQK